MIRSPLVAAAALLSVAFLANGYLERRQGRAQQREASQQSRCAVLLKTLPEELRERMLVGRYRDGGLDIEAVVGAEVFTGVRMLDCSPAFLPSLPPPQQASYRQKVGTRHPFPNSLDNQAWMLGGNAPSAR